MTEICDYLCWYNENVLMFMSLIMEIKISHYNSLSSKLKKHAKLCSNYHKFF